MSRSREKLDLRQHPVLSENGNYGSILEALDPDLLHVRVRQSPKWLYNERLAEINQSEYFKKT
ncbi:unnamed protein product [Orchesella dallaii]|uniref:Uncharacterized protein n=1 Tax=Orchesella dallaii TaxID=48710 RepID=A0ABP1PZH1_9HEXA